MNRDIIKMLAMATMLVNHIANVFMPAGAPLTNLCLYIGYFTAVTMCYFLVEGYGYTHSKTQYAGRLFGLNLAGSWPYFTPFSSFILYFCQNACIIKRYAILRNRRIP